MSGSIVKQGMKERPILFTAPNVRALLDGSKTQTRRVVKDLPPWPITEICHDAGGTGKWMPNGPAPCGKGMAAGHWRHCPYGQPGDRLWVRETWQALHKHNGTKTADIPEADRHWVSYPASGNAWDAKQRAARFMPRWASRILLEITSVRVERLQAIGDKDAIAEGIERVEDNYGNGRAYCDYRMADPDDTAEWFNSPVDSYRTLWEQINGTGSWDANPFVWVVEFRRVHS